MGAVSMVSPRVLRARTGFARMGDRPGGKLVYRTSTGLEIGCRWVPPPPRDHGVSADRVQALILWGRPLAHDQVFVAAMCTAGRRP
jgi:hypothetical protein